MTWWQIISLRFRRLLSANTLLSEVKKVYKLKKKSKWCLRTKKGQYRLHNIFSFLKNVSIFFITMLGYIFCFFECIILRFLLFIHFAYCLLHFILIYIIKNKVISLKAILYNLLWSRRGLFPLICDLFIMNVLYKQIGTKFYQKVTRLGIITCWKLV